MPPASASIQDFGLYGEQSQLPDVMHCETIAARSALHDWTLEPHRHARLHQLLLVYAGGGTARLDDRRCALGAGTLVNLPSGCVHAFAFDPGTEGLVLTLADALLDEVLAGAAAARRLLGRAWDGPAADDVQEVMTQLAREYATSGAARALVLRGFGAALLGLVARHAAKWEPPAAAQASQGAGEAPLLRRFEVLLETHFREHWGVADYARTLAVSPAHLSRVSRALTGQPVSRMIDARLVREAQRLLVYTDQGVATIGYGLGFSTPGLFSRVFSRVTGLPPSAFRRQVAARHAAWVRAPAPVQVRRPPRSGPG